MATGLSSPRATCQPRHPVGALLCFTAAGALFSRARANQNDLRRNPPHLRRRQLSTLSFVEARLVARRQDLEKPGLAVPLALLVARRNRRAGPLRVPGADGRANNLGPDYLPLQAHRVPTSDRKPTAAPTTQDLKTPTAVPTTAVPTTAVPTLAMPTTELKLTGSPDSGRARRRCRLLRPSPRRCHHGPAHGRAHHGVQA